jgi:N-acetylglucosamine kinase-like BadF-type ATPase
MNPAQPVHLGVDGGATHSFAVAVTRDGQILASAKAGSLNFFGSNMAEARRSLEQLLSALKDALPSTNDFANAVLGSAALFAEATPNEKENLCAGLLPLERTHVVSDCMTAYFGATLGQPGVLVIAGTGSIVLAQNDRGQFTQLGGWGHLLGDEGSAYWIAREAVRAAIAAREQRGPSTVLGEAICRWFRVQVLNDVVPMLHDAAITKEKFAGLAQFLATNIDPGDEVFHDILVRAGRELAVQAKAAIRSAGLQLRPVPVYFVGSVLTKNPQVHESFACQLQSNMEIRFETPLLPPVLGAAALSLRDAGVLTPEVIEKLRETTLPWA